MVTLTIVQADTMVLEDRRGVCSFEATIHVFKESTKRNHTFWGLPTLRHITSPIRMPILRCYKTEAGRVSPIPELNKKDSATLKPTQTRSGRLFFEGSLYGCVNQKETAIFVGFLICETDPFIAKGESLY